MATTETVEIKTRIPADLHQRFVQLLPMFGSTSWFMRESMEAFVNEFESEPRLAERVQQTIQKLGA